MKYILLSLICATAISSFSQIINIPDANFKAYLVGNSLINTNLDTEIQVSEANSFAGVIDCSGLSITDLAGIEEFVSLGELYCWNNQLTSLDVSNNVLLTNLTCALNQLTSLDVSNNTLLTVLQCQDNLLTSLNVTGVNGLANLYCWNNQLTDLDLTGVTGLTFLRCEDNQIVSVDVSANINLAFFHCQNNLLSSIDVTQNTTLFQLLCQNNELECIRADNGQQMGLDCSGNPLLFCVSVTDPTFYIGNATFDLQTVFSVNCGAMNTVTQNFNLLTSDQIGATYQWLDCDNNDTEIVGEINQLFTATSTGNYSVKTILGCYAPDTSTCISVDCGTIDINIDLNGPQLVSSQNNASYQWLDCDDNYSIINGENNLWFTATTSGSYAVEITMPNLCGGIDVDTSACTLIDFSNIDELNYGTVKLSKITDLLGREANPELYTPLIYYYTNGTIRRVFKVEL